MRSVILCEGTDDLWFIAYYLHKTDRWNTSGAKNKWKSNRISTEYEGQKVEYMCLPEARHLLAIKSTDGQANLESSVEKILELNEKLSSDWVDNIIIFRDCDDRDNDALLHEMESWFPNGIVLKNNEVSTYDVSALLTEEYDFKLHVLPLVIPFDEAGAIETLLVQAISDSGADGRYVAERAKKYIDEAKANVSGYLKAQRMVTKAKYAAAMAVVDPTHTRDDFEHLMMSTPWEKSASIRHHMTEAARLICGEG